MILEDLILLGRTVPVESKKHGVSICGACYSPEMRRLIRVYPLSLNEFNIKNRGVFRAKLRCPSDDSRHESFRLLDYSDTGTYSNKTEIKAILSKFIDTIENLNLKKFSLGVLNPYEFSIKMRLQKSTADTRQLLLFEKHTEKKFKTGSDYPVSPYVVINDDFQKFLPLRTWQIFELMRKRPDKICSSYIEDIFKNKNVFFIIGNHVMFRNVWLVIEFYSYAMTKQMSLFDSQHLQPKAVRELLVG